MAIAAALFTGRIFGQAGPQTHTWVRAAGGIAIGGVATALAANASRYAMYVMDYGAPVGCRVALKHPERVSALIVQNGNAYEEGLREFWDPVKAYWAEGTVERRQALAWLVTLDATKFQYTDGVSDVTRISPDNWVHDQTLLDRPGNSDIQLDLYERISEFLGKRLVNHLPHSAAARHSLKQEL